LYREALDVARGAESLGFGSVWTTEHHFVDDGYMPSLLPMSAALGAVTSRIEIGTGVVLAPLYQPLRLAEDAATVSLLTGGRFVLGLGLGWSAIEFAALGSDLRTRGRAMTETLQILRTAWSGSVVSHHGEVYDLPEVGVRPVPDRPIPVVIGGMADEAVKRAARHADGFFSNASPSRLAEQAMVGRETMMQFDRDPSSFRWLYYTMVYPCDDPDRGWEDIREEIWRIRWKYSDMERSASRTGPIPSPPILDGDAERRLRDSVLLGTPKQIAQSLIDLRHNTGVDLEFVLRSYFPGFSLERQLQVMEDLAEAIPLL